MKRGVVFAAAAILVAIGIVLIIMNVLAAQEASRGNGWKQARGTIESAAPGQGDEILNIAYRYKFADRDYRSQRVTYGKLTKTDLPSRLARYRPGRTVLIYVNPANPAEAVLELGRRPSEWPAFAGGMAIFVGIALMIGLWRMGAPADAAKKKPPVRKPAPPMSRLKPPPPVKRT